MKIKITDQSRGGGRRESKVVELSACPREGESVFLSPDSPEIRVKAVLWVPGNPDYEVELRCW
jgi:hypothetical protein